MTAAVTDGAGNRPHILITAPWPDRAMARARDRYVVTAWTEAGAGRFAEALRRFDAVCPMVGDRLPAEIFADGGLRTRLIANYGAGVDHIDLAAAQAAGVAVSNTPDVLTEATAEAALMLMLMCSRGAGAAERRLRAGRWTGWSPTDQLGRGLAGRKLGLVGFGRIARATAALARGLGMTIGYHARHRVPIAEERLLDAEYAPLLHDLLSAADIVSLHCPGGPATRHLIDHAALAAMKASAILINTARGSVVDQDALAAALNAGTIASAGLDVYEAEPLVPAALLACEHAVLLPHIGSATIEAREAMGMRALDNLDAFFAGGAIPDRVA